MLGLLFVVLTTVHTTAPAADLVAIPPGVVGIGCVEPQEERFRKELTMCQPASRRAKILQLQQQSQQYAKTLIPLVLLGLVLLSYLIARKRHMSDRRFLRNLMAALIFTAVGLLLLSGLGVVLGRISDPYNESFFPSWAILPVGFWPIAVLVTIPLGVYIAERRLIGRHPPLLGLFGALLGVAVATICFLACTGVLFGAPSIIEVLLNGEVSLLLTVVAGVLASGVGGFALAGGMRGAR